MKILYVEDNPDLREMMALLMQDSGSEVVSCGSGEAALEACATQRFDLVVTDISLPGMSGIDLTRKLLAADADRWIAVCSGYDHSDSLVALGPNVRALPKPFEIEELQNLLSDVAGATTGLDHRSDSNNHDR